MFSYKELSLARYAFSSVIDQMQEPTSYADAIKHKCQRDAIDAELEAVEANETWDVIDLPPRKLLID